MPSVKVRAAMPLSRSQQMARISGTNTKPEMLLRRALWAVGVRYRVHAQTLAGRPDVVIPSRAIAIFIDGCFWHGCPDHYVRPRSRPEFWAAKLAGNVLRDRVQTLSLEGAGWRVVRVLEHDILEAVDLVVARIVHVIGGGDDDDRAWRVVQVDILDATGEQEARHLEQLRAPEMKLLLERRRITAKRKTVRRNIGA